MPGTATLKILNEPENRGLDTCATCPSLCRWACPVAEIEARETTSPQRLVVLAGLLKRDRWRPDQADSTVYHCSHCMACTQACLHDNDVPLLLSLARSRLLAADASPEAVHHVSGQFAVAGNAMGRPLDAPLTESVAAANQSMVAVADDVYWPGCEVLGKDPEAAGDALRAATLSGQPVPAVVAASGSCCGLPLFWAGELDGFRGHAARFAAQLAQVKTVVAHDPTCAHALRVRYRQVGVTVRPRILTIIEYLAEAWPAARAARPAPAYIDGCAQARGMREVDAPRTLIQKATGRAAIELPGLTGERVDCCGGQGLLPELVPATATAMAQTRIDAFAASGADRLVTASPRCRSHLRGMDPSLPIEDLVTWLAGQ